jgi:uncharacterized hydrophobic protein (TIGR00271 family)
VRQLHVATAESKAPDVIRLAQEHNGANVWRLPAEGEDTDALVVAHLPNRAVGPFIEAVTDLDERAHITLIPRGVIAFRPPPGEAPDQVADVSHRSPIEIFLGGIQSVGSLRGLIGYSAAGGIVAWVGLYTNTVYLLTASMLIIPFAGPAMNAAIATAAGRPDLLRRSVGRYVLGLVVTIAVSALLTVAFGPLRVTQLMAEVGSLSSVLVLLPLTAGAAGALNLVQSERDSLVSGAAVGILVAASLAPPTALVGMALVHVEWGLVQSAAFVLVTQLVGIHLSGTIVFRLFGLSAHGVRFMEGKGALMPWALATSALVIVGLVTFQLWTSPDFQRSTQQQRAASTVNDLIDQSEMAHPVEIEARFTRADIPEQNTLLVVAYVQRADGVTLSDEAIEHRLTKEIQTRLAADFVVTPLVSVTVLAPPGEAVRETDAEGAPRGDPNP